MTNNVFNDYIEIEKVIIKYSPSIDYLSENFYVVKNLVKIPYKVDGHFIMTNYEKKKLMHPTINTFKLLNNKQNRKNLKDNSNIIFIKKMPQNIKLI